MSEPRRRRRPQMVDQTNDTTESEIAKREAFESGQGTTLEFDTKKELSKLQKSVKHSATARRVAKGRKRKTKRRIAVATLVMLIVVFCVVAVLVFKSASVTYMRAHGYLSKAEYHKAAEMFEMLGSYEDATKLAMYCKAIV